MIRLESSPYRILNKVWTRLILYTSIAFIYWQFMKEHSPLGATWLPYPQERMLNAIHNIFNNFELVKYGFTSFSSPELISNGLINNQPTETYLVNILEFIFYIPLKLIGSDSLLLSVGPIVSISLISLCAACWAEISIHLIGKNINISKLILSISIYLTFLTSTWAYRILLSIPSHNLHFLLFTLLSILSIFKSRLRIACFFYCLACLFSYQWGFIVSFGYITLLLSGFLTGKIKIIIKEYFPWAVQNIFFAPLTLLIGLFPSLMTYCQALLLKYFESPLQQSNSSWLYRIGIDTVSNIHHGGWLSALQFLGGNRITLCLNPDNTMVLLENALERNIYLFNCSLSILGLGVLSILSLIGILATFIYNTSSRWIIFPLLFSLFLFAFTFQQSWAVHLQGYSIIFAPIFSLGLFGGIILLTQNSRLANITNVTFLPMTLAIVISNIRVSYLTGVNG